MPESIPISPQDAQRKYYLGIALLVMSSILFSAKAIFIKIAFRHGLDPMSILSLRMLFSIPFFSWVAYRSMQKAPARLSRRDYLAITGLGVLAYFGSSYFDFQGLQYVTASIERLILYTYPTVVLLLMWIFFKKPITRIQTWALLLTYLGISVAFSAEAAAGEQRDLVVGGLWLMLCSITYAMYVAFGGHFIDKIGSLRFTSLSLTAACVVVLIYTLLILRLDIWHYSPEVYGLALALALFSTVAPTFLVAEGIRLVGSGNASIVGFVGPVSMILMANIFLGESITVLQLVGTAIVLAGVLLISWRKR